MLNGGIAQRILSLEFILAYLKAGGVLPSFKLLINFAQHACSNTRSLASRCLKYSHHKASNDSTEEGSNLDPRHIPLLISYLFGCGDLIGVEACEADLGILDGIYYSIKQGQPSIEWAIRSLVRWLIGSKLKSPFGTPPQTLEAFEWVLLVFHETLSKCSDVGVMAKAANLVVFFYEFERAFNGAKRAGFFAVNSQTVLDWLTRIRKTLFRVVMQCGMAKEWVIWAGRGLMGDQVVAMGVGRASLSDDDFIYGCKAAGLHQSYFNALSLFADGYGDEGLQACMDLIPEASEACRDFLLFMVCSY